MAQTATVNFLTAGSSQVTAQCEGITSASVPVTVTQGAPGASHEPPGYTPFAVIDFAGQTGDLAIQNGSRATSAYGISKGAWVQFNAVPTMKIAYDLAGVPCCQYVWPTGLAGGNSNGQLVGWDTNQAAQYGSIFESHDFTIPSATLEMPGSGEMKLLGYWGSGASGMNGSDVYNVIGGASFGSSFNFFIRMQNIGANWTVGGNLAPATINCNLKTNVQLLMTTNDIGVANGQLDVWINNVHTHNYHAGNWPTATQPSAGIFRNASNPNRFYRRVWNPIWGGGGGTKTRNDYLLIDKIYMSGKP